MGKKLVIQISEKPDICVVANKNFQNKIFSSIYNFLITKFCVAIRLGEDGTRMGGM